MRADINLSVRPLGSTKLGVRAEMKNMNSLKSITRAIEYETARHIDLIESGNAHKLKQETRRWDDEKGKTYAMRSKENAQDYRYFPNPDLPPIVISDEWIERVRQSLPELPEAKFARYTEELGLSEEDSRLLTGSKVLSDLCDHCIQAGIAPQTAANWITGEVMNLSLIHIYEKTNELSDIGFGWTDQQMQENHNNRPDRPLHILLTRYRNDLFRCRSYKAVRQRL